LEIACSAISLICFNDRSLDLVVRESVKIVQPEQFIMGIDDPPIICLVCHGAILTGARGYVKGIDYKA
jgi:hypothetical protein